MVEINKIPQFSDTDFSYEVDGYKITLHVGDDTEEFDFTDMPDGVLEEITPEVLTDNFIVGATKVGKDLTIDLLYWYGPEEREVYENGEN